MKMSVSKRIEEFVLMLLFYDSVLQLKATLLPFHSSKETSQQCCFYLYLFFIVHGIKRRNEDLQRENKRQFTQ